MDDVARTRALASLAHRGNPAPVDVERRVVRAWRLYTEAGIPREPGWVTAQHWFRMRSKAEVTGIRNTTALNLVAELDLDAAGTLVLTGGVGSGRTYAACWLVWLCAWRCAGTTGHRMARWIDSGDLALPLDYPRRGDPTPVWSDVRKGVELAGILVLDDLGAAGTEGGVTRARELIEARHRAGRLTVVTTNATDDTTSTASPLARLLGGRLMDRSEVCALAGASLRSRKIGRPPPTPDRVTAALERLGASERLDGYAQVRRAGATDARLVDAWLRRETPQAQWDAELAEELQRADAQAKDIGAKLAAACAKLRVVPAHDEVPDAHEQQRAHDAKVAKLNRRHGA